MDLAQLKSEISTNALRHFYVFAGEETEIMKIYIKQISKVSGLPVTRVDSVRDVYEKVSRGALVKRPSVYVVQDDNTFLRNEKLWSIVPRAFRSDILIIVCTKIDKRSKFFKTVDYAPFNPMAPSQLCKHIQAILPLSESAATSLAEDCQRSYNRCLQECHKITSYMQYRESQGDPVSADMAYRLLVNFGQIYRPVGDVTFELVEAIVSRKSAASVEKLLLSYRIKNESKLGILSLLYNKFRALVMYLSLPDKSTAAVSSGLSSYELSAAQRNSERYTLEESLAALQCLQDMEYGIKTGTIDEALSLDYFIATVL